VVASVREKIFKHYALKSIDAVRAKLRLAILYIERNPETVKSITSFPTSSGHSDVEMVLGRVLAQILCTRSIDAGPSLEGIEERV
jgi:hypothetical protein